MTSTGYSSGWFPSGDGVDAGDVKLQSETCMSWNLGSDSCSPYTAPHIAGIHQPSQIVDPISQQAHRNFLPLPPSVHRQMHFPQSTAQEDEEVRFYNEDVTGAPKQTPFQEDRCSSTDTSVSVSSCSTATSWTSTDAVDSELGARGGGQSRGSKRKRTDKEYRRYPKPPYSYTGMIVYAILSSPEKRLSLGGVQRKLMEFFPFFRGTYTGWKDSVRHNLSVSKCFVKIQVDHPLTWKRGDKPRNKFLWGVDLYHAHTGMFRRQNFVGKESPFNEWLHEELGIPSLQLPVRSTGMTDISGSEIEACSSETGSSSRWTGYAQASGKFSMRVPTPYESCVDSPFMVRNRNSLMSSGTVYDNISPTKADHQEPFYSPCSSVAEPSLPYRSPMTNIFHVMNYVASNHCSEPLGNVSALDNLSLLCSPPAPQAADAYGRSFTVDSLLSNPTADDQNQLQPSGKSDMPVIPPRVAITPEKRALLSSSFQISRFLRPISPAADDSYNEIKSVSPDPSDVIDVLTW